MSYSTGKRRTLNPKGCKGFTWTKEADYPGGIWVTRQRDGEAKLEWVHRGMYMVSAMRKDGDGWRSFVEMGKDKKGLSSRACSFLRGEIPGQKVN